MTNRPPDLNVVAWDSGSGWTSYHLEETEKPGRTLCLRTVPAGARVQRHRTDDGETCRGCLAVLAHETRKRLTLERA